MFIFYLSGQYDIWLKTKNGYKVYQGKDRLQLLSEVFNDLIKNENS